VSYIFQICQSFPRVLSGYGTISRSQKDIGVGEAQVGEQKTLWIYPQLQAATCFLSRKTSRRSLTKRVKASKQSFNSREPSSPGASDTSYL
jgi:hypothetical protein